MKEGKDAQVDVVVGQVVDDRVEHVPVDLAVADHGPLGQAGGAPGKDQAGDILLFQRLVARGRVGRLGDGGFVIEASGDALALDVQVVAHGLFRVPYRGLNLGDNLFEIIRIDQRLGRRVLDEAHQFAPVEPPVEGSMDGAQLAAGIDQVQVLDAVAGQNRHPVAVAHAHLVAQPVGQPIDSPVPLLVGQPQRGVLARVDDGQFIGAVDLTSP